MHLRTGKWLFFQMIWILDQVKRLCTENRRSHNSPAVEQESWSRDLWNSIKSQISKKDPLDSVCLFWNNQVEGLIYQPKKGDAFLDLKKASCIKDATMQIADLLNIKKVAFIEIPFEKINNLPCNNSQTESSIKKQKQNTQNNALLIQYAAHKHFGYPRICIRVFFKRNLCWKVLESRIPDAYAEPVVQKSDASNCSRNSGSVVRQSVSLPNTALLNKWLKRCTFEVPST